MVEVVVPFDPETGRREMPAILHDHFGAQAGLPDNPLFVSGSVVRVPARQDNTYAELGTGSGAAFQNGLPNNNDGGGNGYNVVPTVNGYVAFWFPFYGRVFGIRVGYGAQPCTVSIDGGAAIRVNDFDSYVVKESRTAPLFGRSVDVLTHTDLEDGVKHYARVEFPASASSSTFLGYLLDAKYYQPVRPVHIVATPLAVPVASGGTGTSFSPYAGLNGAAYAYPHVSKIVYSNPTASPIDLSWYSGSTVILTKTIAAKDVWEVDFPTPIAGGQIVHAGSGVGLYATAFGGYFG